MNTEYFSLGSICAAYGGETELRQGTFLERFFVLKGTPDFCVTLHRGTLPPEPKTPLFYQTPDSRIFRVPGGWQRRCAAEIQNRFQEYAVLFYDDRRADLTISPACTNIPGCVENCTAFEHLILRAGGLLLHASHIQYRGQSIVFTAPSGTGKSTQAALWEKYRGATIINGDKTLLTEKNGIFEAAGIPYAGTSGICEPGSAPVRALVILEQAKENTLTRLRGSRAAAGLLTGVIHCPWQPGDTEIMMNLLTRVVETVPIYLLSCLPDESAVEALEKVL